MTDKTKCPECKGNKIYVGAGYIEHKCPKCNGSGFFDEALCVAAVKQENHAESIKEALKEDITTDSLATLKKPIDLTTHYPCGQKRPVKKTR